MDELTAFRNRVCRLDPEWALTSLEEADAWIRERGAVEVTPCCSLPSLHVAVHEPPYRPGSRGFGAYPAGSWWWAAALGAHDGLHQLKIHRGKTLLVTTAVALLADGPARAALGQAEEGDAGELERRLVRHLGVTGPSEVGDLRAELGVDSRPFRAARERLERTGAIVSRSLQLEPHRHSSLLSRWDQIFPAEAAGPGGLDDLLVALVRAAVTAPEREAARWLSWPAAAGALPALVESGRLVRVGESLVTAEV